MPTQPLILCNPNHTSPYTNTMQPTNKRKLYSLDINPTKENK